MSGNLPFGFSGDPGDQNNPNQGPGGFDMSQLGAMLQQLGAMLQSGGNEVSGPVDWDLAHNLARQSISQKGDPSVNDNDVRRIGEAFDLAQVWLDAATLFPAGGSAAPATWSRSEWLEATWPAWQQIIEPIAEGVQQTLTTMPDMGQINLEDLGIPGLQENMPAGMPDLNELAGPLMNMAKRMGAAMFGAQVGNGLATLADDVLGASDVTIPLTSDGRPALVSENVKVFGADLDVELGDLYLFLALREAAHQRLYAHVPWLRTAVETAVRAYASGISVDTDKIQEALQGINPNDPEAMQEVMSSGVFEPAQTEEQKQALSRLETLLALIEGWVQDVVAAAIDDRMPSASRLGETMRRRRASGGPAEKTFATLIGLELRPRALREASALWTQLRESRGIEGRDGVWRHPDLIPTAEDLTDPTSWLEATGELGE
ncbi:MAG: zinc-dependent metalloprotease [Actinobacteria bacterium]|jgi:putative hydrolase|nr:zinc-dependent metalloprotease [Micrococcales bacterium]MCB0903044.1 zinc-dependent metalloprotease [Actinomycetota bacterium]MCO5300177.1 zinc-dependent metalloprotease [Candidatus Nanopelagicales bacterium]MCB9429305.1 zinc-dependent metalloprotease [Actinomycetota bacterium]HPE11129.1 zinc-dependent metalloprotease [Actinomycetota bacterium]